MWSWVQSAPAINPNLCIRRLSRRRDSNRGHFATSTLARSRVRNLLFFQELDGAFSGTKTLGNRNAQTKSVSKWHFVCKTIILGRMFLISGQVLPWQRILEQNLAAWGTILKVSLCKDQMYFSHQKLTQELKIMS